MRDHGRYKEEGRGWNARERTIIARIKQYLEGSVSVKVQVEALEDLLDPEDVDVGISGESRKKQETKEGDIFLRLSARTT